MNTKDSPIPPKAGPRFDLPTIESETQEFWSATQRGALMYAHCTDCGKPHYYPRPFCPFCWSENVNLKQAKGSGTLYTWSTVYSNDLPPFKERLPYVAAIVDLDEGVRLSTNIVQCPIEDLRVGMPVQVVFEERTPEVTVALFKPA